MLQDLAGIWPDPGKIWPGSGQHPARSGPILTRLRQDLVRIWPDSDTIWREAGEILGRFFWIHSMIRD